MNAKRTNRWGLVVLLVMTSCCGPPPAIRTPAQTVPARVPVSPNPPRATAAASEPSGPYPYPSASVVFPPPTPATPAPEQSAPVIMGEEMSPLAAQEVYTSVTIVFAPVGSGPGEIGYWTRPEVEQVWADDFVVDARGTVFILDKANRRVVRFDSEGRFAGSIPYPEGIWYADLLAVGPEGTIYLNDIGSGPSNAGVKTLDDEGNLLHLFRIPWWFADQHVYAISADENGTVWVEGRGAVVDAPIVEGYPYLAVIIPLGNEEGSFDADRQLSMAVVGRLLRTGGPVITFFPVSPGPGPRPGYIYDQRGQRLFQLVSGEKLVAIDGTGCFYTRRQNGMIPSISKYDSEGKTVTSVDLPGVEESGGQIATRFFVTPNGAIYALVWDFETRDGYRVVRWEKIPPESLEPPH